MIISLTITIIIIIAQCIWAIFFSFLGPMESSLWLESVLSTQVRRGHRTVNSNSVLNCTSCFALFLTMPYSIILSLLILFACEVASVRYIYSRSYVYRNILVGPVVAFITSFDCIYTCIVYIYLFSINLRISCAVCMSFKLCVGKMH